MKTSCFCTVLLATCGVALGQHDPLVEGPDEFLDDPYLAPRTPRVVRDAPRLWSLLDANTLVQVNVDENGSNIVGDAANESTIAVDPTAPNRIVIGWRQFDNVSSNFRQAGYAWSNDGGRSWHFDGVLEPGVFRSDPVLDVDADGDFYYYSLTSNFTCQVWISRDGGRSWEPPIPAFGGDKNWIAVDRTGGIGRGNVYGMWKTSYTRSTNGAVSFESPRAIPLGLIRGVNAVGPDGAVYIAGQSGGSTFGMTRSDSSRDPSRTPIFETSRIVDMGGAFVARAIPNPGGLPGQVWIAADYSAGTTLGNVYMLSAARPPGDPMDTMFAASPDGGDTWDPPVRVNDDPIGNGAWQWFGTLSVAPNGRIDAVWNDTRNTGLANMSELHYSFSTDAGQTWAQNVRLSAVWDSHVGWPNQNKIGDYYHMVSDDVGVHLAWAATFNGEQDVYYMRIGDYDCNGNGIGDEKDLLTGFALDCNGNGIPDSCEIAAGAVPDLNGNGIPDPCECYADCDTNGVLDIFDFLCFQNSFVLGETYACDCDPDPACDIFDFLCFQNAFVGGCP